MSEQDLHRADLLTRRLAAVGEAATLNARILKSTQQLAGVEMEMLRIELELQRRPSDADLADALETARDQFAAAQQNQNECAGLLEDCEQEIAEIDRQLAIAMAGLAGGKR
ncbi:hypothetical protein LMIY3S_02938 [Labrys miyagiensis]